ncbi:MAG: GAF domain-containing sensor histidine kinase [Actinobacteria bacterium]|nr:GAF domain-containing sensor histidine kinase [Actinomycetota bacterium]
MPQDRSDDATRDMQTSSASAIAAVEAVLEATEKVARAGSDLNRAMTLIVEAATELTAAEGATLGLVDGDELVTHAAHGSAAAAVGAREKIGAESRDAARAGLIYVGDGERRSLIRLPVPHRGRLGGMLVAMSSKPDAFSDRDVRTLQLLTPLLGAAMASAAESRSRSSFISVVSHELRNPLASIRGLASLMRDKPDSVSPEEQRRFSDAIVRQADRMAKLVEDLQAVVRMESGDFSYARMQYDVDQVVRDVVTETQAVYPTRRISLHIDTRLPTVIGDPDRVRQVIANLLENACRYSDEESPITLDAKTKVDRVDIAITDHGIGIPEEFFAHLFDRFARVPKPGYENVKGTGLGLFISKNIVEAQGGHITVTSKPGAGSTFTVSLPWATET